MELFAKSNGKPHTTYVHVKNSTSENTHFVYLLYILYSYNVFWKFCGWVLRKSCSEAKKSPIVALLVISGLVQSATN